MSRVVWNGDGAQDYVQTRALGFVTRACKAVERRAKELLSIAGTGKVKGMPSKGIERSKPGEPPRKQTGELRRSVTSEVDDKTLSGRVGTNMPKGRYLELGTKRGLLPRPWLRRALAETQAEVNQLLSQIKD